MSLTMHSSARAEAPGSGGSGRGMRLPGRRRLRRAVTLLLMSAVVPGSAQLVCGSRSVGRIALRAWLGLVGLVVMLGLITLLSRTVLLGLSVRPTILLILQVALVAVAAGWAALMLDAWRLGFPLTLRRRQRQLVAGLLAGLLLVGVSPLLLGAHYAAVQRDLVSSVFAGGGVVTDDGRLNLLVLGADASDNRIGLRPESVTLVSLDSATGEAALLSLPGNLHHARFPQGSAMATAFPKGFDGMLDAVYSYGTEHPDLFPGAPDPGAAATRQAVEGTLGIPVRYHVLVDLAGVQDLVDALGGITLRVAGRVPIGGGSRPILGWIESGVRQLNGYEAIWYARSREGSSDDVRMTRQRCVVAAMADRGGPRTLLTRFEAIAEAAKRVVTTDLPRSALPDLVELATGGRQAQVRSVAFVPPAVDTKDPDVARIRRLASAALDAASETSATSDSAGTPTATGSSTGSSHRHDATGTPTAVSSARPPASGGGKATLGASSVCGTT